MNNHDQIPIYFHVMLIHKGEEEEFEIEISSQFKSTFFFFLNSHS